MEPNKDQPKAEIKKNVSIMAKAGRLVKFDDLDLIDQYASRFGQDPDYVYDNTSFGTIVNFMMKWKEQGEYQERFNFIWHEINAPPTKS